MKLLFIAILLMIMLATGCTATTAPSPKAGNSVLPPGLTLDPNGVIHGTPTTPGIFVFTITAQDAVGATATTALTLKVYQIGDVNQDFGVNVLDMILVGQNFGSTGSAGWIPEDINSDGVVNVLDMILVGQHFGQ